MNAAECIYFVFFPIYFLYSVSVNIFLEKGSLVGIIVSVSWLAFLVCFGFVYYKTIHKFLYCYLFLFLLLFLIFLNSSGLEVSLKTYCKCAIGILCLPLSYSIINSKLKLEIFLKINMGLLVLVIIYLLAANVFKWQTSFGYGNEKMFSTGNMYSDILYLIVYTLLALPLILSFYSGKKWGIYILSIICFILLIAFMKRTIILMVILGMVIIYSIVKHYLSRYKLFYRSTFFSIKSIFLCIVLVLCIMPFFWNTIEYQFSKRERAFSGEYLQEEGRVREWIAVSDEILQIENLPLLLLGKEPFNSVGNYGQGKFGPRQIHSDYSTLLHGAGILGFLFYFGIHVYLFTLLIRLKRRISLFFFRRQPMLVYLFAISVSLILLRFVSATSGNVDAILSNAVFYSYIGITLRAFSDYGKKLERQYKHV